MANKADIDESRMRVAHDAGDYETTATLALERYGSEIASFLIAYLRSPQEAEEVFAQSCEYLWHGLPRFEWRTSLRAWFYTIARHAAIRHKTVGYRKPGRNIPLSNAGLSALAESIRSRTALHLRTETKSRLRTLRERLAPDDQTLVILRVDRGMSWRELTNVLRAEGAPAEDPKREEARLRKRFQLAKEKLRELARAEGLIE